jgi:phosphoribosyl 1,2-cyclic phosphodiesterase
MILTPLASGSKGNAFLVETSSTKILIDSGLSAKKLVSKIEEAGAFASDISAIFITHEHVDHIGGARVFAKKFDIPVFMNQACYEAAKDKYKLEEIQDIRFFETGLVFDYQDISIHPLRVTHDTVDPVCFSIDDGKHKIAIVTDLGKVTTLISTHLTQLDALVLESNHDLGMLKANLSYPEKIKQRIRSSYGHLSNTQSAEAARDVILKGKLRYLMLAHLSENNNSELKSSRTFKKIFEEEHIDLPFTFAKQECISNKIIL